MMQPVHMLTYSGSTFPTDIWLPATPGIPPGWVSYTLSKSDCRFENINQGRVYAFKYDRRHDFSIVINHKLSEKASLSATWVYGSGYPTTLHNGVYLATEPGSWEIDSPDDSFFDVTGEAYLYLGKNWLRMRDYHRLDLGVNFKKERKERNGKKQERTWAIGVYNAYNRQNAVFYYFGHKGGDY